MLDVKRNFNEIIPEIQKYQNNFFETIKKDFVLLNFC